MERLPELLFPAIPPSVARLAVDGSTGKKSPCGFSAWLRWSSTIPGCTRTRRAAASRATTSRRCLLTSTTTAAPTV